MTEVTYTRKGDYQIPDFQLTAAETPAIGKYGRMKRAWLKENQPMILNDLILTGRLYPHLLEIQQSAAARMEQLMKDLLLKHPAPEKKRDPMNWTRHMNSLQAQAEELVIAELITS